MTQRAIIEQLLGITILSEKAENLKELVRVTKSKIQEEQFRIKAVEDANSKIVEQVDALKRRQTLWQKKKDEGVEKLKIAIDDLAHVDIDAELRTHTELNDWHTLNNAQIQLTKDISSLQAQIGRAERDANRTKKALEKITEGTCSSCGQSVTHLDTHKEQIQKADKEYNDANTFLQELQKGIEELETQNMDSTR